MVSSASVNIEAASLNNTFLWTNFLGKREFALARLDVHHLIDYTEEGEAYIAISRLAGVQIDTKVEEV